MSDFLERLRDQHGSAEPRPEPHLEPHPEPHLTSSPIDTPWGVADLLASPLEVGGVRLHTPHPPRHLGSDAPHWLVDERHDEEEADRVAPRGPRTVVLPLGRTLLWAALSAAIVWATQGALETAGAAVLAQPEIGARWWSNPGWAVGAALQAVTLAVTWMLASRRLTVGPALALAAVLGAVAHLVGATLVYTGALPVSVEAALSTGTGLGVAIWSTGAALVQLGVPLALALTRPFLRGASSDSRAVDPRYARRGRHSR